MVLVVRTGASCTDALWTPQVAAAALAGHACVLADRNLAAWPAFADNPRATAGLTLEDGTIIAGEGPRGWESLCLLDGGQVAHKDASSLPGLVAIGHERLRLAPADTPPAAPARTRTAQVLKDAYRQALAAAEKARWCGTEKDVEAADENARRLKEALAGQGMGDAIEGAHAKQERQRALRAAAPLIGRLVAAWGTDRVLLVVPDPKALAGAGTRAIEGEAVVCADDETVVHAWQKAHGRTIWGRALSGMPPCGREWPLRACGPRPTGGVRPMGDEAEALAWLKEQTANALPLKYPDPALRRRAQDRAARELDRLAEQGVASWMAAAAQTVRSAKDLGVLVGPGRGSVGGSVVAYLAGVTEIDPLAHGLLFSRFLAAGRASLPDIDIDIQGSRRGELFAAVAGQARGRAVRAAAWMRLDVKGAARKAAEATGANPDKAAKAAVQGRLEAECGSETVRLAHAWTGAVSARSTHPCAVMVADRPLADLAPVRTASPIGIGQWDPEGYARWGIGKIDLLSSKALDHIALVCSLAGIDPEGIPAPNPSDTDVWDLFARPGGTLGVFQCTKAMRDLAVRLHPGSWEQLAVLLALDRPGPLRAGMADAYLEGRPTAGLPGPVAGVLADTRGVFVFQEQAMMAGQAAGAASETVDTMRRASQGKVPWETAREGFMAAADRAWGREAALAVWDALEASGGYMFSKAHAVAYALLMWRHAWLKARHPGWFAVATARLAERTDKAAAATVRQSRPVRPHVNHAPAVTTLDQAGRVLVGLDRIRSVPTGLAEQIVAEREHGGPYVSLEDFAARTGTVSAEQLDMLAAAGALDGLASRAGVVCDRETLGAGTLAALAARALPMCIPPAVRVADTNAFKGDVVKVRKVRVSTGGTAVFATLNDGHGRECPIVAWPDSPADPTPIEWGTRLAVAGTWRKGRLAAACVQHEDHSQDNHSQGPRDHMGPQPGSRRPGEGTAVYRP